MLSDICNIIDLPNDLSSNDKFNFETKMVHHFIRIFPASFRDKMGIHEYPTENNIHHYLFPDRQAPMKSFIRRTDLRFLECLKKPHYVPSEKYAKWKADLKAESFPFF